MAKPSVTVTVQVGGQRFTVDSPDELDKAALAKGLRATASYEGKVVRHVDVADWLKHNAHWLPVKPKGHVRREAIEAILIEEESEPPAAFA
jgi:hypothetical protein